MTKNEAIEIVKVYVGDPVPSDAVIGVYLDDAQAAILGRLYPFGTPETVTAVPPIYERAWCKLASRYILRRGAEGEIAHDENGTSRRYGSVNDEDILSEITPYVKICG